MEAVSLPHIENTMEENQRSKDGQLNEQPSSPKTAPEKPTSGSTDSSTTATKEEISQKPLPSGIKYRVEYRDEDDVVVHTVNIDKRDFDITSQPRQHIFEVVTTYRTHSTKFKSKNSSKEQDGKNAPEVTDTRSQAKMIIHSQAIIHALRSVVQYYPGQDLLGESISIISPYPVLVHHEKELADFRERCDPSIQTGPVCIKEKDAYEHLKILQDFLEETVMPAVRDERERNQKGIHTFAMYWLVLKPGSTWRFCMANSTNLENDIWRECVVESVEDGILNFGDHPWRVRVWYLDFDGHWIGRCRSYFLSKKFDNEMSISAGMTPIDEEQFEELPESENPPKEGQMVADLVAQGKKLFDLLHGKCQDHSGTTSHFPFHKLEGLVMVDMKTYYSFETAPYVAKSSEDNTWVGNCACPVCKGKRNRASESRITKSFSSYDGLTLESLDGMTPHHYFLLPKTIPAFVFKTRNWEQLSIKNLSEPEFRPQMMDTLVMNPIRLQTIKALAGSYIRENRHKEKSKLPNWSADFIQGKGQGQIFLLHGKPGVGKTYTAECVAQYTKRPLMVMTSSDIGTDPQEIEDNLMQKFKMAANWGAILLIDEADVFMEQRSTNDLNRNSLVAGFLRALEFYEGILFLTTNRVGTFDDAFISRIHVKLYYPDFTDEERQQIWKTFMDKLIQDRGSFIRVSLDAKDYIKGKEIREVKWNGREIRNAFQTAVALAEYEADKDEEGKVLLKDTHLSAIVEMSQDFKKYLERLHLADEDKRALQQGLRID